MKINKKPLTFTNFLPRLGNLIEFLRQALLQIKSEFGSLNVAADISASMVALDSGIVKIVPQTLHVRGFKVI